MAEVRLEGARCTKNLLLKISEDEDLFKDFITKILLFSTSNKYNLRQTFIYMCLSVMKFKEDQSASREIFVKHFMNELVRLSTDRVVNVRMCLSEVLSLHHKQSSQKSLIGDLKPLYDIYELLKKDKSADVRDPLLAIIGLESPQPQSLLQEEESKESDE